MTSLQRSIRESWFMFTVAAIAVLALAGGLAAYVKGQFDKDSTTSAARRDLTCIEDWANAYSDRARFIQKYLVPRNDTQNAFEIAIADSAPQPAVDRLRKRFIAASNAYAAAQKEHPLPQSPRFLCAERAGLKVPDPDPVRPSVRTLPPPTVITVGPRRSSVAVRSTATVRPRHTTTRAAPPSPTVTRSAAPSRTAQPRPPSSHRPSPPGASTTTSSSSGLVGRILCSPVLGAILCRTETP